MKELREYQTRLVKRLWEQPQDLRKVVEAYEANEWLAPLEDEGWSVHQVVAHLCHVEWGAFLPRFKRILEDNNPILANFDESGWMETNYDPEVPMEELLQDFVNVRQSAKDLLDGVQPEQLSRTGQHPFQGERTLQWWMEYAAAHADEHLKQISGS
jgi:hypothetical protein